MTNVGTARLSHADTAPQPALGATLIVGAATGGLVALLGTYGGAPATWMFLAVGCVVAPCLVAVVRLRAGSVQVVPLLVGLGLVYVFLPGLLGAAPGSGLTRAAGLTLAEFEDSQVVAHEIVVAFTLPLLLPALVWRSSRTGGALRPDRSRDVRSALAVSLGVVGALAGLFSGLRYGTDVRLLEPGAGGGPLDLLPSAATPVPAALWLAGRRSASLALLPLVVAGPFLTGGRQDVLTPLIFLMFAVLADRHSDARQTGAGRGGVLLRGTAVALLALVVTVAVSVQVRSAPVADAERSASDYAVDESSFAPLLVAVAREDRPQWLGVYGRALAAPVPRAVWPGKPLSYDYSFRERHFPQYGGGIPITFAGTSYLSFGFPGVLAAGCVVAGITALAMRLFVRGDARSVLLSAALVLLTVDVMRIGGLYRELLTATLIAAAVLLVTRGSGRTHAR